MRKVLLSALLLTLGLTAAFANGSQEGVLNVAAQNVNETVILAHMAKQLIEAKTDFKVKINTEFAGSAVLHQAMVQKEIDVYPTWTGTQLTGVLRYEGENLTSREAYEKVKTGFEEQFNFTWSEPIGFNNTYIYVVRRETAEKYNLNKASDLAPYAAEWLLAGDENFDTRSDAYPGWSAHYDIEFKRVLPMQYSLIYRAIDNGEVDSAVAYATDSRIDKLDLVTLEDDLSFFPAYSGAFVIRQEILESHPEVLEAINSLGGQLNDTQMSALNSRYDDGEDPAVIAQEFLSEQLGITPNE